MKNIEQIIEKYKMQRHPEGGYYSEVFRSDIKIKDCSNPSMNSHAAMSSIFYLLTKNVVSKFHSILQDETWHYYSGGILLLHLISPSGEYKLVRLGSDFHTEDFQFTVPANWLMAAEIVGEFCLLGCTVAPAFEFTDFNMPNSNELLEKFPNLSDVIIKLS